MMIKTIIMMLWIFIGNFEFLINADEITEGFSFSSPEIEGGTKWKVEGDRVNFLQNNLIEIIPVRAVVTTDQGKIYRIYSDWAHYDKQTQIVQSEANVEVLQGTSRLKGVGFIWNPQKNEISVLKEVDLGIDTKDSDGFFPGI